MVSKVVFVALVACVGLLRLWEVRKSRRNEAALLALGGLEHAHGQMPWMVALHAAWLLAMPLEVFWLRREFVLWLALPALLVFAMGQTLRMLAMRTLGKRWTVKVITVPGLAPVTDGPFAYVRHPNYLGVVLEIAALPLVHGAFLTAALCSLANAALLFCRVRAEERALSAASDYGEKLADRPRFVPGI